MNSDSFSLRHLLKAIYSFVLPGQLREKIARILAYEYRKKTDDTRLIIVIKIIANLFLVYFPLLSFIRIVQRICSDYPYYPFKDEIVQKTTRVIFTRSKRNGKQICLKIWQRTEKDVCDDRLIVCRNDYLIEGLKFNRKFAPNIYLGTAAVIVDAENRHQIQRGRLIKHPTEAQMENSERFALVMKTLKSKQRLDQQLEKGQIETDFLAHEIVRMHRTLENSPAPYGSATTIMDKLHLNEELFLEAMSRLTHDEYISHKWIGLCLNDACKTYAHLFEERYNSHHIKRCHGDLKATNLWIHTAGFPFSRPRLIALDCIDFKPEFCYIDTLSDVAMLAIDLERLLGTRNSTIAYDFLHAYLQEMQEHVDQVEPLLEYYMAEKALVCAYVSILYDTQQTDIRYCYLDIASKHAARLSQLMGKHAPRTPTSSIHPTRPFHHHVLIPVETTLDGSAYTVLHSGSR